jgi:hypothetical protein
LRGGKAKRGENSAKRNKKKKKKKRTGSPPLRRSMTWQRSEPLVKLTLRVPTE